MARSLMELYGGGMTGPTTNYQLGGRIARARRGSEYQGEQRRLREQAEKAARRQKRAGGLGSLLGKVGAVAGSFIPIPGVGTALGSAIGSGLGAAAGRALGESTYTRPGVGEGKYLQKSRGDVKDYIDIFKESQGERALTEGLTAAYKSYAPSFTDLARDFGIGGKKFAAEITKKGIEADPTLANREAFLTTTPSEESLLDFLPMEAPVRPDVGLGLGEILPDEIDLDVDVPAMVGPEMEYNPLSFSYDDMIRYGNYQGPMMSRKGGGLIDYMVPQMQGGGYATATDPMEALRQMGMGDIAEDVRLQDYLTDLPQFGQGYEQKIGDIRTGAQTGLFGLTQQAQAAPAATSFAGAGAPQTAMQRQREQMMTKYGQQKRGVVEGYQADLLSAIRDIEERAEITFGSGAGTKGQGTVSGWPSQEAYDNWVAAGADINALTAYGWSGTGDPHTQYGQTGDRGLQNYLGCFTGDTLIATNDDSLHIEEINSGDIVMTFDLKDKKVKQSKVTKTYRHKNPNGYIVINDILKTTPNHPFYSDGKWIEAGKLSIGDKILHMNGMEHEVKSIEMVNSQEDVYNIEVDGTHNYFAEGYLVHNK